MSSAAPATAIVTGGAGAIGSRLVSRLLDDGFNLVTVIDDLSSGYRWLLPEDSRLDFREADVRDVAGLEVMAQGALVFHLAALFANQNSIDHPFDDLQVNGQGTLAMLHCAATQGASRVVYASAGCSMAGPDVSDPIHERMPVSLSLSTPYQITKLLGELYCNYYETEVATVRCRFFNSYGPGEVPGKYRNVIPNFIWAALHDEPLLITGTGHETRDFVFVDDLVDGLVRAATTPEARGCAFNLGRGIETEIGDLAALVVELTGTKSEIVYCSRRPWDHCVRRQADISAARHRLGFEPLVAFGEGLARTITWFEDEYDRIAASVKGRA